jgi:hypothetical protein
VEVLDYETLVADFEAKLVTQLRSFGPDAEYLEMWVPDQDPVKSILNMVEAAEAFGRRDIAVRVEAKTLAAGQVEALVSQISALGQIEVRPEHAGMLILVTDIGVP